MENLVDYNRDSLGEFAVVQKREKKMPAIGPPFNKYMLIGSGEFTSGSPPNIV